jgi:hypothetical protein
MSSVFAKFVPVAYPYQYKVTLHLARICGGIPSDPSVAEGWIKSKLADKDVLLREEVAKVMLERGINADEAAGEVDKNKHLNGFKRTKDGLLYVEGRQVKAMIKESANIRWPYPQVWGPTGLRKVSDAVKGQGRGKVSSAFFAEHVFVQEDVLTLGVTEPTDVMQRFVQTWRGSAIQYEEYVDECDISFTVASDWSFTDEQWALLWLTAEQNGLGATRSQGYGRFEVTQWDVIKKGKQS